MSGADEETGSGHKGAVLVGVANPRTVPRLIGIANLLAEGGDRDIVAVAVVVVPPQLPLEAAGSGEKVEAAEHLVQQAVRHAEEMGARAHGLVEISREVHQGLLDAAERVDAGVVVLGFSPLESVAPREERSFDRVTDRVSAGSKVPVMCAKFGPEREIQTVLLPFVERLDLGICGDLLHAGKAAGWQLALLATAPADAEPDQVEQLRSRAAATAAEHSLEHLVELQIRRGDDPVQMAIEAGSDFDATVVGAPAETVGERLLGSVAERIARASPNTVFLVRGP